MLGSQHLDAQLQHFLTHFQGFVFVPAMPVGVRQVVHRHECGGVLRAEHLAHERYIGFAHGQCFLRGPGIVDTSREVEHRPERVGVLRASGLATARQVSDIVIANPFVEICSLRTSAKALKDSGNRLLQNRAAFRRDFFVCLQLLFRDLERFHDGDGAAAVFCSWLGGLEHADEEV